MAKNSSDKRTAGKTGNTRPEKGQPSARQKRPQPSRKQAGRRAPEGAGRGQALRSRPANENEPGTAALISRMRKRPSSAPLWLAFAASLMWVLAFFALFSDKLAALAAPMTGNNLSLILTGTLMLFLPVFLSFSTAYLLWRAQQMRHVSEGLIHTALRLIRPQEVAADGLMSISQSIRYDVDQLVGGIEHAMARAGELEGMVHREISNIERAFGNNEERIRTLLSGLENQRNALREAGEVIAKDTAPILSRLEESTASIDGVVKSATSTLIGIDEGLQVSSGNLKQTVEEFSNRAGVAGTEINNQTQRMDQMSGVLVNEMRVFSESLTDQIDALSSTTAKINKESSDFNENIHSMENRVVSTLKSSAEHLAAVNTDVTQNVERMTGTISEQLTTTGTQFSELLQSTSSNLTYHLKSTATEVAQVMEKSGIDVSEQIASSGVDLSDKLLSVSGDFVGNVAQARDDLYTYLEDASTKMTDRLGETTKTLFSEVERSSTEISSKLEETTGVLFNRVADATGQMSAHLDESTQRLSGSIEETSTQMVQRLETSTSRMSKLLDVASSDMTSTLEGTTSQLADRLDKSSTEMTRQLAETSQSVTGQLETTASDLATSLEGTTASLTQYFDKTTGDVTSHLADTSTRLLSQLDEAAGDMTIRLDDTTSKLAHQLDGITDGMTGKLSDTTVRLTEQLSVASEDMTAKLTDSTSAIAMQLEHTSKEMTGRLDSTTTSLTDKLDAASYELSERLDSTASQFHTQLDSVSGNMLGRIETTVEDLGKRFDVSAALLEDVTTSITKRFDGTSEEFTTVLEGASARILTDLGAASTAFAEGLKLNTDQITGGFEETTAQLAERVEKATDVIESRTNASSRRLEEAGVKFAGHMEKANAFLTEQLASTAEHMDSELETISTTLTGRLETTSGKISARLGDASGMVERAVDHFNNGMDKAIQVRETQMDDLISTLANKAEDVDTMMRNYVSVIEDSLSNAHNKSEDIGRLLTAQSDSAATNLQAEITRIEATSDEQIAKAAQALGQQYETVIASLNSMLASTTSEFADTAQDMRAVAQQVAKDIDFTRSELRRTILDLPDETRVNADAMRQVVSDQITALNSLADVVKRQTANMDLSGPGVYMSLDEKSSPGKPEGARPALEQTRRASKSARSNQASSTSTEPTVRGRPIGDPIKSSAERGTADLLPHLEAQQPAVKKNEKQPRSARKTESLVAKLNTAARDLTEAFEDKLPADHERKYNAGQTHIYTHRLYKARGQKMYNMVKQGYTTDRLIRGRIDAYVRLFERLLDTVAEGAQPEELVDACLASESGKLYLLFAQAAGRLEE